MVAGKRNSIMRINSSGISIHLIPFSIVLPTAPSACATHPLSNQHRQAGTGERLAAGCGAGLDHLGKSQTGGIAQLCCPGRGMAQVLDQRLCCFKETGAAASKEGEVVSLKPNIAASFPPYRRLIESPPQACGCFKHTQTLATCLD